MFSCNKTIGTCQAVLKAKIISRLLINSKNANSCYRNISISCSSVLAENPQQKHNKALFQISASEVSAIEAKFPQVKKNLST